MLKVPLLKITEKGSVPVKFVKEQISLHMPRCKNVNPKSIYSVPVRDTGFLALFGFNTDEILRSEKDILDALTAEVQYVFSNVELLRHLSDTYVESLLAMVKAIDAKDPYTRNHSERVTAYSYLLGKKIDLEIYEMRILFYSALLHDIGKIGIPDNILNKQESLMKMSSVI